MMKSSVRPESSEGVMRTETCSRTVSGIVLAILNYRGKAVAESARDKEGRGDEGRRDATNLEDEVIREDVLDGRNDVLHLGLGELNGLAGALVDRSVVGELGDGGELRCVGGLGLSGGGGGSRLESSLRSNGSVHGLEGGGSCDRRG